MDQFFDRQSCFPYCRKYHVIPRDIFNQSTNISTRINPGHQNCLQPCSQIYCPCRPNISKRTPHLSLKWGHKVLLFPRLMQWHFTKRIHLQSGHFQSVLGSKKEPKKEKGKMGSRMMDPVRKIYIGGLPNNANKYDIEVWMNVLFVVWDVTNMKWTFKKILSIKRWDVTIIRWPYEGRCQ